MLVGLREELRLAHELHTSSPDPPPGCSDERWASSNEVCFVFTPKELSKVCFIHVTANREVPSVQQSFGARCHSIVVRRHQNKPVLRVPLAAFRQENNSHRVFSFCSLISCISNIALLKFVVSWDTNINFSTYFCLKWKEIFCITAAGLSLLPVKQSSGQYKLHLLWKLSERELKWQCFLCLEQNASENWSSVWDWKCWQALGFGQ